MILSFIGVILSTFFFIWIERNMAVPIVSKAWGLPLFYWDTDWVILKCVFNIFLFVPFSVVHSVLARSGIQNKIEENIIFKKLSLHRPERYRQIEVFLSGLLLMLPVLFWQNTGILIWAMPFSWTVNQVISIGTFLAFTYLGTKSLAGMSKPSEFFGFRSETKTGSQHLKTEGLHGFVRHPLYLFTLLAVVVTPVLPLDRILVFVAFYIYLRIGIPLEEMKLVERFGLPYLRYRSKVPAVFPRIGQDLKNAMDRMAERSRSDRKIREVETSSPMAVRDIQEKIFLKKGDFEQKGYAIKWALYLCEQNKGEQIQHLALVSENFGLNRVEESAFVRQILIGAFPGVTFYALHPNETQTHTKSVIGYELVKRGIRISCDET